MHSNSKTGRKSNKKRPLIEIEMTVLCCVCRHLFVCYGGHGNQGTKGTPVVCCDDRFQPSFYFQWALATLLSRASRFLLFLSPTNGTALVYCLLIDSFRSIFPLGAHFTGLWWIKMASNVRRPVLHLYIWTLVWFIWPTGYTLLVMDEWQISMSDEEFLLLFLSGS